MNVRLTPQAIIENTTISSTAGVYLEFPSAHNNQNSLATFLEVRAIMVTMLPSVDYMPICDFVAVITRFSLCPEPLASYYPAG